MRMNLTKRVISAVLTLALLLPAFAVLPITAGAASASAVTDTQTLSSWKEWFSPDSSRYSGGVFLDKSVYTANEALTDEYFSEISGNLSFEQDNFGNDNFMVALSALGSNSEVLGYSYTPTDTVLVLDASTSMGTGAGKLVVDEANVKIEKDGSAASSVVFVNSYSASATDVLHVSGAKHLIGRPLVSGEFAFELYAADQNYNKLQLLETTHNEKDGTFRFATELSFAREGTYYYVITEVAGDKEGVTYDESVYGVKITVVDEGAGKLVSSHEHFLVEEDGLLATEEVRFENVFTMDPPDRDPGDGEEEDPSGKEEIITPPEKAPQTGDEDCTLWFILLSVTSIGVLSTFFCKKEKTEE